MQRVIEEPLGCDSRRVLIPIHWADFLLWMGLFKQLGWDLSKVVDKANCSISRQGIIYGLKVDASFVE